MQHFKTITSSQCQIYSIYLKQLNNEAIPITFKFLNFSMELFKTENCESQ